MCVRGGGKRREGKKEKSHIERTAKKCLGDTLFLAHILVACSVSSLFRGNFSLRKARLCSPAMIWQVLELASSATFVSNIYAVSRKFTRNFIPALGQIMFCAN